MEAVAEIECVYSQTQSGAEMARKSEPSSKIQDAILNVLERQKGAASTEEFLKEASGVKGLMFKNALIRLTSMGLVIKWKNERYENFYVGARYAHEAHYSEVVVLPDIYSVFGHSKQVITVYRSIPFVVLEDRELGKIKSNRYREQD